jgi:hypothetical protein
MVSMPPSVRRSPDPYGKQMLTAWGLRDGSILTVIPRLREPNSKSYAAGLVQGLALHETCKGAVAEKTWEKRWAHDVVRARLACTTGNTVFVEVVTFTNMAFIMTALQAGKSEKPSVEVKRFFDSLKPLDGSVHPPPQLEWTSRKRGESSVFSVDAPSNALESERADDSGNMRYTIQAAIPDKRAALTVVDVQIDTNDGAATLNSFLVGVQKGCKEGHLLATRQDISPDHPRTFFSIVCTTGVMAGDAHFWRGHLHSLNVFVARGEAGVQEPLLDRFFGSYQAL